MTKLKAKKNKAVTHKKHSLPKVVTDATYEQLKAATDIFHGSMVAHYLLAVESRYGRQAFESPAMGDRRAEQDLRQVQRQIQLPPSKGTKMSIEFTKREEEVIQLWLGWLISGVFVEEERGWVSWGDYKTFDKYDEEREVHEKIGREFNDRQSPSWNKMWDEAFRRYHSIPLVGALL